MRSTHQSFNRVLLRCFGTLLEFGFADVVVSRGPNQPRLLKHSLSKGRKRPTFREPSPRLLETTSSAQLNASVTRKRALIDSSIPFRHPLSSADGAPPYLMAVAPGARIAEGELEFLIGGTASSVPKRYCLPHEAVADIAATFVQTEERMPDMRWEEV
jgi:hypothetical protein